MLNTDDIPENIKDVFRAYKHEHKSQTGIDKKDVPNLVSQVLDVMIINAKQPHKEMIIEKFSTEELKEEIEKRELTYEPKVVQEKILSQCTVEELNQEIERRKYVENYTKRIKLLIIYTTEELKQEIAKREITQ